MEYDYVFELKKDRKKSIDVISILVLLLSIIAFSFIVTRTNTRSYLFMTSIILLVAGLIRIYIRRRKTEGVKFALLLLIAGLSWMAAPFIWWVAIPVLLLSVLEKPAKTPLDICFSKEGIILKNLFPKKFHWRELQNALLKDGILTLDFKNNHIIQKEITDSQFSVEEYAFNQYCNSRLSEAATAPITT